MAIVSHRPIQDASHVDFKLHHQAPRRGAVERANRTHTEEYYQVTPCSLETKKLNRELRH